MTKALAASSSRVYVRGAPRTSPVEVTPVAGVRLARDPPVVVTDTKSTTSMTLQTRADSGPEHENANAVPSTAAVVPPPRTSNDPVSLTLAARLQVSPAVSAPRVWRPPCSSVSRSIVYSVDAPRRVSDPSVYSTSSMPV